MEDIVSNKNVITNFEEDIGAALLRTVILAKSDIPYSHKKAADNFIVIKRIYNFHTVKVHITLSEYDLLKRYDMEPLENTTIRKANEELEFLKKMVLV